MEKGTFIALEGIDGSGKSSQIGRLTARLEGMGVRCLATREPTGGPVGSLIRQIFTARVIAALYAADRIDHLVNEVDGLCAAIDQGITVVSDRYYFSSYAYHSVDVDMDWVIQANALSAGLLRPTLTVFLDVPVETALERIHQNRRVEEIFDRRLEGVERVAVVDGSGTQEQVAERIWAAIAPCFSGGTAE